MTDQWGFHGTNQSRWRAGTSPIPPQEPFMVIVCIFFICFHTDQTVVSGGSIILVSDRFGFRAWAWPHRVFLSFHL